MFYGWGVSHELKQVFMEIFFEKSVHVNTMAKKKELDFQNRF